MVWNPQERSPVGDHRASRGNGLTSRVEAHGSHLRSHLRRHIRSIVVYSLGTDELLLEGSAALLVYHAEWLWTVRKVLMSMAKPRSCRGKVSRVNLAVDIGGFCD